MHIFVNEEIRSSSFSVQLPQDRKKSQSPQGYSLNFINKLKSKRKSLISPHPYHHILANVSQSQSILSIKQQIEKLRTESPQIIIKEIERERNYSCFKIAKSNKKKQNLAKIVMAKLKKNNSRELGRKAIKQQCFLPKIDMEGKSCWRPKKFRYIPHQQAQNQQEKCCEMFPMNSVVKIKYKMNPLKPLQPQPALLIKQNNQNQSVSGWKKSQFYEQEDELILNP